MKKWSELSTLMMMAVLGVCCLISLSAFAEPLRPTVNLDGAWSFRMDRENVGETEQWHGDAVPFDDTILVPGAWEAQGYGEATDKLKHHFIGKGWYKREVEVPAAWSGRRVFLCIGGVHRYAAVWVNGVSFGEHIGCLSPFEYDITDCAPPGSKATVAIRVDSEQRWDIDTMIGAWDIIDYMDTYWGGIWGHVTLEARNAAYLEDLYVEPYVSPTRCRASVTVRGTRPDTSALRLELLDQNGAVLQTANAPQGVPIQPLEIEAPEAKLWTPDTPQLYRARMSLVQGDTILDAVETRFGFREIAIEGVRILLNGKPLFLRGYGDDAIYPETMAAPSDEAVYRKKIEIAKAYGFNHVRHHSHFLPPEYYDVCDELGMLVSPELPIGYQQFYNKAQGPALELYKTEWAAAIRRFRNHPSILDWCMGNEMYESIPIAPELYRIAKELDTTRPVVDTDGVWVAGFGDGTRDRDTLDLYFMQFDVFNTPLDNPDLYHCPAPLKPVISHETGNFVTFPRLDQIDLFQHNFIPFWFIETRDKVARMGLMEEVPRWAENTERLYTLLRKVDIEAIRKNPNLSGYHWWLLQDYWTTSNGIIDIYFRSKPGISREAVLEYNNDVVLVEDGLQLTYRGGESLQTALQVSNFGPAILGNATLSYMVTLDGTPITERTQPAAQAPLGTLTKLADLYVTLPEIDVPARITVKARLISDTDTYANEWSSWAYPARVRASSTPLFASPDLLGLFGVFGAQALPEQAPYPVEAVYVSNMLTPELLDAALAGASLVLYKPWDFLTEAPTRFKSAWWKGSESDNNAGTVVYDSPVTRAMAPEGWCDASWYRLLENSDGYLLDGLPSQPEVLVRGVEVGGVCRNKSMLFQAAAGEGCLLVCGLNLDATLEDGTPCPAAQWLTGQLIEYAESFPDPSKTFTEAFLRERAAEAPRLTPPFVEGFARLLRNEGESANWFTYRKQRDTAETLRQMKTGVCLEWETAPVPDALAGDSLTLVFAGALGWVSQPATEGFALSLNGTEVLRFDATTKRSVWHDASGRTTLNFVVRRSTSEDAAGIFYLNVPSEIVVPGQPVRITVASLGTDSQRWFALHPYTDVLGGK